MHDMSAPATQHGAPTSFIRKHVFSIDHKVIGKQYYALALVAAVVGMFLSWLMRIHLGWGNFAIPGLHLLSSTGAPGDVMTPEYYLQLMTMHGTIMVFFVLTTAPFAAFGNFFLPIQTAAERGGRGRRPRPRSRRSSLGGLDWNFLHRPTAGFAELHHHHARHAL
jgi:cytochrome c oxidase subunit 1